MVEDIEDKEDNVIDVVWFDNEGFNPKLHLPLYVRCFNETVLEAIQCGVLGWEEREDSMTWELDSLNSSRVIAYGIHKEYLHRLEDLSKSLTDEIKDLGIF